MIHGLILIDDEPVGHFHLHCDEMQVSFNSDQSIAEDVFRTAMNQNKTLIFVSKSIES